MSAHETEQNAPEQAEAPQAEEQSRGPEVGSAGPGAAGPSASAGTQPRKTADLIRAERIADNLGRSPYGEQKKQVSPAPYGGNYDKAGLKKFKPEEDLTTRDLSAHAVGEAPSSWQARVVDTFPSAQINPDDPGHTYHLLDDETVVSTSEPATVDEETANAVSEVADKAAPEGETKDKEEREIKLAFTALETEIREVSSNSAKRARIAEIETEMKALDERIEGIRAKRRAGGKGRPVTPLKHRLQALQKDLETAKSANPHATRPEADPNAPPKSLKEKVADATELKGTLAEKSLAKGDAAVLHEKHENEEGFLGSKNSGETNALHAGGEVKATATVSSTGVEADVTAEGKATLVDVQEKWEWSIPFNFMGEKMMGTLFLTAKGMVGVEGKAQLKANVGKMSPDQPKIDEQAVMAGVDVFAGAKLTLGVGVALEWDKQKPAAYKGKINTGIQTIIKMADLVCPGLGWVLNQMGADEQVQQVMEWLFEWGKQGKVALFGIEAMVEGSAGAGAAAKASIGLRGGKFDFMTQANVTWGVGLGGKVKISVDIVEGPKFALIVLGEMTDMLKEYATEQLKAIVGKGIEMWDSFWEWLGADNRVRDAVDKNAHKVVGVKEQAKMIETMMSGSCTNADEDRIIVILRHCAATGTMSDLLDHVDSDDILWALDGKQDGQARGLMGV